MSKPPLGVTPRSLYEEEHPMVFDPLKRKQAIEAAVARYREVNKLPLPEWEEELVYLNTIIEGD